MAYGRKKSFFSYVKGKAKQNTNGSDDGNGSSSRPLGMQGLYRTLMAFGIILLVGTLVFYIVSVVTSNINNPANTIVLSMTEVIKNLSTILGTALATIIAFYFGIRGTESAVEKTARTLSQKAGIPDMSCLQL
jgi:hypothetical protein